MQIRDFDPKSASDDEIRAIHALQSRLHAETWPEDNPLPVAETLIWMRNMPAMIDFRGWAVWDDAGESVIARADFETWRTDENQHLGEFSIGVLPEYRCQGLAARLLGLIVDEAQARHRRLLHSWAAADNTATTAFLTGLGARPGLETHTNQLVIAEVDRRLMRQWVERGEAKAQAFRLELIDGPYPEADIQAISDLFRVMNDAPRGSLDVEDEEFKVEHVRQWEATMATRGLVRWRMQARHIESGELAGFTEVVWNPYRPDILQQWGTGVKPKFRGHGLGRWLKAAMLEKVLRERPSVRVIRTGNADTNGPMLRINYDMGFKPYKAFQVWEVETEQVARTLAEKQAVPVLA
ncbi:MAG: GNAT family N-acetyltransferase [Anaerolineae bacterium]|nr:GNAT family N-acetyltransferase [Anaerolineae bacterium]